MSRAKLSEQLNRLLPGESYKRIREAILAGAGFASQRTETLRKDIAEENRLKTGLLVIGTIDFVDDTNADIKGFAWAVNFLIFQQSGTESLAVTAPDANVPRVDYFIGLDDGSVEYRAGTIDEDGNAFEPTFDSLTEVLLRAVTRNPDSSNDEVPGSTEADDNVKKSVQGNQTIQSSLTLAKLARTAGAPLRVPSINLSGLLSIPSSPAINDVYSTKSGSSNYSRLIRVDATQNNQGDYKLSFDLVGVKSQQGQVWIEFSLDGSGDMEEDDLKVFGEIDPARLVMVKIASYIYDIFISHTETADFFKWRPRFSFGSSDKYTFFHQEDLDTLPAGDQYSFTAYGGGTELDADIVDALEAANAPDAGNPFATIDDIPIVPEDFSDLLDTPSAYTGAGGYKVKVKGDETGLEFVEDTGGGGGRDDDAVHYDAADGKTASEKQQARDNIGVPSGIPQIISGGSGNNIPRTSNYIVFTGNVTITGFVAGEDGEELYLHNRRGGSILIGNNTTSSAGNRIKFPNGGNYTWPDDTWLKLKYDGHNNIWNVVDGTRKYVTLDQQSTIAYSQGASQGLLRLQNLSNGMVLDILNTVGTKTAYWHGNGSIVATNINIAGNANKIRGNNSGTSGTLEIQSNFDGSGTRLLNCKRNDNEEVFAIFGASKDVFHGRSTGSDRSIRRDEQRLYYLISVTTSGAINDQALTDGIFNYRFTAATSITGFANGEIGRTIDIDNDSGADITLSHESGSSIAANRINLIGSADLTIPNKGKVTLKYCTGSRWELVSKNF